MALLFLVISVQIAKPASWVIGRNFVGSTFGPDSDSSPADGNGAVGPQHFVELVNGRFSIYDKATGTRVQTKTDVQFWAAAGLKLSSTVGITDPRTIFDIDSQRWFASMVDFTVNSPRQRSNHFLLAVSQSSDPTGAWHGFAFASDTNGVNFADFPTLGIDQAAVYMSGDMFDRLGNPIGPTLVSIPKAGLLASPANILSRHSFGTLSYGTRGDILQPAITIGNVSTPQIVMAVSDIGTDSQPHHTLVVSTLLNSSSTNATLATPPVVLDVPAYTAPGGPAQPDGSHNLDSGDARFSASVRRVGDSVYATHAVEVNQRSAIRWYRINASTASLTESGTITDPDLDLFYPSIAANLSGTVVIGCNGSSGSVFVSSYAVVGEISNGKLSFGNLTLLKAGRASYQNPDATGTSRWGDYSATSLDPADPNRFWTIQMIAETRSAWATQITELITGASTNSPPTLAIARSVTNLTVSWPATDSSFQLQEAITLAPASNWTNVNQTPLKLGNLQSVLLPASGNEGFFRLISSTPAP